MLKNSFVISGTKDLIFRIEKDATYVYDPYELCTYKLNKTATEIAYMIYLNYNMCQMIDEIAQKHSIDKNEVKNIIQSFIKNSSRIISL